MLKTGLGMWLLVAVALVAANPAQADGTWSFDDEYWGGDIAATQTDYLGFFHDMTTTTVQIQDDELIVCFYTGWAQRKYDGSVDHTYVEDIFIDFDGYAIPAGEGSRFNDADDHGRDTTDTTDLSGSIWDAVIHVDDTETNMGNTGAVSSGEVAMYAFNSTNIDKSIVSGGVDADGTPGAYSQGDSSTTYRKNQEVRVELADTASDVGTGMWEFFGGDGSDSDPFTGVKFTVDISGANFDWTQWALKYATTCANDVVFVTNVPEPGSALLILGGLASGFVARRRRKARASA